MAYILSKIFAQTGHYITLTPYNRFALLHSSNVNDVNSDKFQALDSIESFFQKK